MTRAEIRAYNRGVATVVALAAASATVMRVKLVKKPTRYSFAIEALEAIVEAGNASMSLEETEPIGLGAVSKED